MAIIIILDLLYDNFKITIISLLKRKKNPIKEI